MPQSLLYLAYVYIYGDGRGGGGGGDEMGIRGGATGKKLGGRKVVLKDQRRVLSSASHNQLHIDLNEEIAHTAVLSLQFCALWSLASIYYGLAVVMVE